MPTVLTKIVVAKVKGLHFRGCSPISIFYNYLEKIIFATENVLKGLGGGSSNIFYTPATLRL